MKDILLDENIRNYATIPIFVFTILVNLIRQNFSSSNTSHNKGDLKELTNKNIIERSNLLKRNAGYLPYTSFNSRRNFLCKGENAILNNPPAETNPFENLMKKDPTQATTMFKGQLFFLILQGGMGFLINYIYSGFIVAKVPFPLTFRFKSMIQRGIDVASLDVSYVSSMSWYFFIMVCSGGIIVIINWFLNKTDEITPIESPLAASSPLLGGSMAGPSSPMKMMSGQPQQLSQAFREEREALDTMIHPFYLASIEEFLLREWEQN